MAAWLRPPITTTLPWSSCVAAKCERKVSSHEDCENSLLNPGQELKGEIWRKWGIYFTQVAPTGCGRGCRWLGDAWPLARAWPAMAARPRSARRRVRGKPALSLI